MTIQGIRTPNISNLVPLADAFVVNRAGATGLQAFVDLVNQMMASGPLADALAGRREALTADRTYFVSSTGNDNNSGLTSISAFRTKQKAVDVVLRTLDCKGFNVLIQCLDGAHTDSVIIDQPVLNGTLTIRGNTANWSGVVTTVGANTSAFDVRNGAVVSLEGFKTVSSGASHIAVSQGGVAFVKNWDFGAGGVGNHLIAFNEGNIFVTGNYKITGGAACHFHATEKALLRTMLPITCTIDGTVAFSNFFAGCSNATLYPRSINFSLTAGSSVSGQRFYVHKNGLIDTNNAGINYFPGTIAGTAINGGIYDLMQLGRGINFAQPGYFIDDQGMWWQWGFAAFNNGNTIPFAATFPSNCFGVLPGPAAAPPSTGLYACAYSGATTSNFLGHGRQFSGGAVSTVSLSSSWIAWGN